jgi:hypothetical protein
MKTKLISLIRVVIPLLVCFADAVHLQADPPTITSVRLQDTNVIVTARVPSGVRRLTLESRARLGTGSWQPRAVTRVDGSAGTTTFTLPRGRALELMRLRADTSEPLPATFYSGSNNFFGQPASSGGPEGVGFLTDGRGVDAQPPGVQQSRTVAESDIWKIRGRTLFFFNQYRGLQVIDLTNPDAATVRATIELPAAGEDLYLLGDQHVVLLAQNGCSYPGDESQVIIVAENNATVSVTARLPVSGSIQESRMVGTALYVASQTSRPAAGTNGVWEWGTLVSSFDLSNPAAPVKRDTLWYPGYGNVVAATDTYLFIVTQDPSNWWQSIVRLVDISAPDGTLVAFGSIRAAGLIPDKFKLDYTGTVLTSISEDWHLDGGRRLVTKLETFRLPDPRAVGPSGVIKLGELELGRGERLHATRFDGNRVYVVTFFQIDPLWVVDLSDPSSPRIAGSVEVNGWSTFILPQGDRLITLGVEESRVAVSLFDVHNPANPFLLNRVLLGQNYSWSEANWDEKAFTLLSDDGLILVPYTGSTTNGYASRVQLIDFNRNALTARGVIEHQFQPRRTTAFSDRVLSLSGQELLSVDATDRDHPLLRGRTALAWSVDRLWVHGDYLLEVTTGANGWIWWGSNPESPTLRVASTDDPNLALTELSLTNQPVLGTVSRGDHLYIAQGPAVQFYPFLALDAAAAADPSSNSSPFVLTVIDLSRLPAVQVVGQTEIATDSLGWGSDWQAVWPKPNVLVWVGGGVNYGWWRRGGPIALPAGAAVDALIAWPPFWGGSGGQLLAFDVSNPAAPQFASEISLGTNNWWSFSPAFTAEGSVYLSHQTSEFLAGLESPWKTPAQTNIVIDGQNGARLTNVVLAGTWVQRDYLDVIDYADAKAPTVRSPVNIPGRLQGVAYDGALLYTIGPHWTTNWSSYWNEFLDASAYDGVTAHLVDSLPLTNAWPRPVLVVETNVFIGHSGYNNGTTNVGPHSLESWSLSSAGRFTQLGSVALTLPATTLADFPGLLAAQDTDSTVLLFDSANPAALHPVGQSKRSGCLWFDLKQADGDSRRGLWLPLGAYGVATIPVTTR